MKISFKKLSTVEDLEELRQVAFQVWPQTFKSILSPEQIKYMMEMMYAPAVLASELANNVYFELLLLDDAPAGYISYSAYPSQPGTAKLHKVYLLTNYHGCGIGQQMLDHARKQCKNLGFSNIMLCVNKHNERAIKAYKRNGFAITQAACTDIGNGFFMDDYIMTRTLAE